MRDLEKPTINNMIALLHDQPFVVSHDLIRNIRTLTRRFQNEGFSFFTKVLPTLGKAIDAALSGNVTFSLPTAFKRFKKSCIPHFVGSALRRVFDSNGNLLAKPCAVTVKWLRTLCYFYYKAEVPFSEKLIEKFEERFVEVDAEIGSKPFCGDDSTYALRNLMRDMLGTLNGVPDSPAFGPGISSNCRRDEKYKQFVPPSRMRNTFGRNFFHQPDEFWLYELHLLWLSGFLHGFLDISWISHDSFEPSKILFVPKDSRGPRVICCEDSRLMYAQKSMQKSLYRQVDASPIFGGQVNFTDQTVNQKMTFRTDVATLDLKDASDRISLDLVIDVFPQNLVRNLLACRSSQYVLPSGRIGDMQKFAPMGSAVCFPVMALVAYATVCSAIYLAGGPLPRRNKDVFVYGDDIICPNEYAYVAISALESVGLQVNVQKSYIDSRFRESCGQDTLDQSTVTPLRSKKLIAPLKRDYHNRKRVFVDETGGIASNLSILNAARRAGYNNLANCLTDVLRSLVRLPYGTPDSPYLCIHVDPDRVSAYNVAEGYEVNGKLRAFVIRDKKLKLSHSRYSRLRRNLLEGGGIKPIDPLHIGARSTYLQQKTLIKWGSSYS